MVVPVITHATPGDQNGDNDGAAVQNNKQRGRCVLRRRQQDFEWQKRRWLARVSIFSPLLPSSLSLALSSSSISGGNRLQDEDDDDAGTVAAVTASRCGQRWRREKGSNTVVGPQLGLRFRSLSLARLSSLRGLLDAGANGDATRRDGGPELRGGFLAVLSFSLRSPLSSVSSGGDGGSDTHRAASLFFPLSFLPRSPSFFPFLSLFFFLMGFG
ncbi:uncharacterized protein DS421_12g376840 [Arachis hypogaea]|nr:uncharacterized protein DS421_12g376840 [Arachis hypogaea]